MGLGGSCSCHGVVVFPEVVSGFSEFALQTLAPVQLPLAPRSSSTGHCGMGLKWSLAVPCPPCICCPEVVHTPCSLENKFIELQQSSSRAFAPTSRHPYPSTTEVFLLIFNRYCPKDPKQTNLPTL